MDQWNRIDSSEINPHMYDQMIFKKSAKIIPWGMHIDSLQQLMLGKLNIQMQKNTVRHLLHITYKNQFKMDQRPKHKK